MEKPLFFRGMEITAPSGKFCSAMPAASTSVLPSEITALPASMPANATPTTIPSGILCRVTASMSMVFCRNPERIPSGSALLRC